MTQQLYAETANRSPPVALFPVKLPIALPLAFGIAFETAGALRRLKAAMRKFSYRTPRYVVDFPVQLTVGNSVITGRCAEISTEGLQVEISQSLPQDYRGLLCLAWRNTVLELCVRLAHTGTRQDALRFVFESEKERIAVADLVAQIAARSDEPGLIVVR